MPTTTTIKELLESGAHFGHQTSRWHPKMKKYIFTKRNDIHIIDLEKTVVMLDKAINFIDKIVSEGGKISSSSAPRNRHRTSSPRKLNAAACITSISAGSAAS